MKPQQLLLAALAFGVTHSAIAADRPSGHVTICKEGITCSVPTRTTVAFGRADKFFYKALNGTFVCTASTFGGRVARGVNECSVPVASRKAPASASAPAAARQ